MRYIKKYSNELKKDTIATSRYSKQIPQCISRAGAPDYREINRNAISVRVACHARGSESILLTLSV